MERVALSSRGGYLTGVALSEHGSSLGGITPRSLRGMGLLGVVTSFARKNSVGFKSLMLHL